MLEIFSGLLTGFFNNLISDVRDSIASGVETYLLSTYDLSSLAPRPLTAEPALQAMFHLTLAMADLFLLLIFTWAFLRSQWERSFRAHYTLKVILPRTMAAPSWSGERGKKTCWMSSQLTSALRRTPVSA